MNCERELITPAVAATAPLTITKYNVTIDKRNYNVWKGLYFITTEYSWKQGNFLIDNFSVASNVSACFMPWMGHILVDMKFRYKISLQHLERIIFLSYVWVLGSKQFCLTGKQYMYCLLMGHLQLNSHSPSITFVFINFYIVLPKL